MGGIVKSVGGVAGTVAQVTRGMHLSPAIQAALQNIAKSGDQRAAFNGILLASAANVAKKPHFNLELKINDLFVRLGNLRGMQAPGMAALSAGMAGSLTNISSSLTSLDGAMQALVKNLP